MNTIQLIGLIVLIIALVFLSVAITTIFFDVSQKLNPGWYWYVVLAVTIAMIILSYYLLQEKVTANVPTKPERRTTRSKAK